MQSWADRQLAALKPRFAKWDIWYVYCQPKHYVWWARPTGTPKATINADSPEELVKAIVSVEFGESPPDDPSAVKILPTHNDRLTITAVGSAPEMPARG